METKKNNAWKNNKCLLDRINYKILSDKQPDYFNLVNKMLKYNKDKKLRVREWFNRKIMNSKLNRFKKINYYRLAVIYQQRMCLMFLLGKKCRLFLLNKKYSPYRHSLMNSRLIIRKICRLFNLMKIILRTLLNRICLVFHFRKLFNLRSIYLSLLWNSLKFKTISSSLKKESNCIYRSLTIYQIIPIMTISYLQQRWINWWVLWICRLKSKRNLRIQQ